MGSPIKKRDGKVTFQLREVPDDVWNALTAVCERDGLPRRTVVLRALRQYLALPAEVDQPVPQRRTPREQERIS